MSKSIFDPSRLIQARVPIGFVIHMTANYFLKNFPIILQVPLMLLVWWEFSQEIAHSKKVIFAIMSTVSLLDVYVIYNFPLFDYFSFALIRAIPMFIILYFLKIRNTDNVVLNYLCLSLVIVNSIFRFYPIEVMLTISMAIAGSDCLQYFFGKLMGKTKIVPKISPNKSLEGYIAAIIGCNIIHIFLLDKPMTMNNFIFVNGMLISGMVGDLFISWWKRKHHIKDTSTLLTGHGGFLDRLDSHIAAWVWSYFFVHMVHSQYGTNFTEMNYGRIETLIAISWACVWLRFFHVAMTKGELI